MALIPTIPAGSGTTSSGRNDLPNHPSSAVQNNLPQLDGKSLTNESVMQRSHINNTAYNIDSYRHNTSLVDGYPEGRVIEVTYYSNAVKPANTISHMTHMSTDNTIDAVHASWVEIRNFEIRCRDEFKYQYDSDSNVSKIDSSGITLPGFEPMVGDIFLYAISGKVGVFTITGINRLALNTNTYHEITFVLTRWLDMEYRDKLTKQRVETRYFDKAKFVSGNTTLLTTDAYRYQVDLFRLRKEIISDYIGRFYDSHMDSFMRPDRVYDPYAVEFFRIKVSSIDHSSGYPIQLLMAMSNYKKTIWGILTNNPVKSIRKIDKYSWVGTLRLSVWSTNITSLLNKEYLMVGNEQAAYSTDPLYKTVIGDCCHHYPHLHHQHEYPNQCKSFAESMNELIDKANAEREAYLKEVETYDGPNILPPYKVDVTVGDISDTEWPSKLADDGIHFVVDDGTPGGDILDGVLPTPEVDADMTPPPPFDVEKECNRPHRHPHHYPHTHHWSYGLKKQHHHHCCPPPCHDDHTHEDCTPKDPDRHGIEFEKYHHKCGCHRMYGPTYILSNYFYEGIVDKMSQVEVLIHNTLTKDDIDVAKIYEYVHGFVDRDDVDAFYSHLFSIYLIDKALYWIRFHA